MTTTLVPPALVFFHTGCIPFYLRCTMESARVFNPESRLFLITDQAFAWEALRLEVRSPEELPHEGLERFRRTYRHISGINEKSCRIFQERWFHLDTLLARESLDRVLYLDSDCMLFSSAERLFAEMPEGKVLCTSGGGGPACSFVRGSLAPFLDLVLAKYGDTAFLDERQRRSDEARARGELADLIDMSFIEIFTEQHPQGHVYSNELAGGYVDPCINVPNGMQYFDIKHRRRQRKRVWWRWDAEHGRLQPFFRRERDATEVPALAIHYQSGAKRIVRRVNPLEGSRVPLSWRVAYYNWLHGGWGSQWL